MAGADRRVPVEQMWRIRRALEANDARYGWLRYRNKGHGFTLDRNQVEVWERVERFLAGALR